MFPKAVVSREFLFDPWPVAFVLGGSMKSKESLSLFGLFAEYFMVLW